MTSSTSDRHLIYLEEHFLTLNQAIILSGFIGLPIVAVTAGWFPLDPLTIATFGGILLFIVLLFLSPLSVGFSHIRITREGLALWWNRQCKLPARELGAAYVLDEHEAGTAAARGNYRGIRIPTGRSSYLVGGREGPAVFVEQHRADGRTVGWLLATKEPEAVIEALAEVRDAQRDG